MRLRIRRRLKAPDLLIGALIALLAAALVASTRVDLRLHHELDRERRVFRHYVHARWPGHYRDARITHHPRIDTVCAGRVLPHAGGWLYDQCLLIRHQAHRLWVVGGYRVDQKDTNLFAHRYGCWGAAATLGRCPAATGGAG